MKDSLCWWCDNCYGGCSWSQDFTPVKGWEAEPTKITSEDSKREISSFMVINCPKFKRDDKFFKKDGRH